MFRFHLWHEHESVSSPLWLWNLSDYVTMNTTEGRTEMHCVWFLIVAERRIHVSPNLPIIGSDNGLSPGRRQAIVWTNAAILLIRP